MSDTGDTFYYRNNALDLTGSVEYLEDEDIFLNGSNGFTGDGRAVIRVNSDLNEIELHEVSDMEISSDAESHSDGSLSDMDISSDADSLQAPRSSFSDMEISSLSDSSTRAPDSTPAAAFDTKSTSVPSVDPQRSGRKRHRGEGSKRQRLAVHKEKRQASLSNDKSRKGKSARTPHSHPSIFSDSVIIATTLEDDLLRGTSTSWKGIPQKLDRFKKSGKQGSRIQNFEAPLDHIPDGCHPKVEELVRNGYQYVANVRSAAQVFLDKNGTIFCVKAAPPKDPSWTTEVVDKMKDHLAGDLNDQIQVAFARTKSTVSHASSAQRDPANSLCVSVGYTHGNGSKKPHKTSLKKRQQAVLNDLKSKPFFKRYIHHVNRTCSDWFPGTTKLYYELIDRYFPTDTGKHSDDAAKRAREAVDILDDSPFTGFSINIGPQALAAIHRDSSNMLNGLCAIAVFGDFDATKSAHLVLHEAMTILEVFPGDVVYLLSSTITHENIPMCADDAKSKRHSLVHYTAGGLFQWLWDGRILHKDVNEQPPADEGKRRFKEIYDLLPTLSDLLEACGTGLMSDHGIMQRIKSGNSLLMRSDPAFKA